MSTDVANVSRFSVAIMCIGDWVLIRFGCRLPGAYGIENGLWPCAISDGVGNTLVSRPTPRTVPRASPPLQVLPKARNGKAVEDILRLVTTEMGSKSGVSMAPMDRVNCVKYGTFFRHTQT